jgi:hypothetical protein
LGSAKKRKLLWRKKRMDEMQTLSIVIEHWIEHNQSHMGEYRYRKIRDVGENATWREEKRCMQ